MVTSSLPPEVFRARHPEVFATTGYLEDAIKINADIRLEADSLIAQLTESIPQYTRDQAGFVFVNLNSTASLVRPIETFSLFYDSASLPKIIDTQFTQFVPKIYA